MLVPSEIDAQNSPGPTATAVPPTAAPAKPEGAVTAGTATLSHFWPFHRSAIASDFLGLGSLFVGTSPISQMSLAEVALTACGATASGNLRHVRPLKCIAKPWSRGVTPNAQTSDGPNTVRLPTPVLPGNRRTPQ